ncbi:MAG: wax ester/triacylglycerol synthase family O-acyltransferase [Burkholderiales bacterium]|nr:MAG: wax ester/triacylglycerol synthase family O-acyltransferase [Burkholderiales bacterium]
MSKRTLSGLDASFLYLETPEQPMHVASVCIYEVPARRKRSFVNDVRAHLKRRMHLAPLFGNVLAYAPYDLGHPHWEAAEHVDLDHHVQRITLAKPGSMRQLEAAVAKEHAKLMDRSRPLWQFTVFDGLEAGHIAFYGKVHHAALDGQGGVVLANAILDLSETPREVPPPRPRALPVKTDLKIGEMIGAAFSNTLAQYAKIVKSIPTVAGAVAQAAAPVLKKAASQRSLPIDFAPRTPFNVNISAQRVFSTASLPSDRLRSLAKTLGGSLNDGVLFVCASALRSYLKLHDALPKKTLVAAIPVSLREESNKELNNQASMVLAELGTHHGDAKKRWQAILTSTKKVKESLKSLKSVLPTDYPGLLAPLLVSRLNQTVASTKLLEKLPPVANVVISNVPGPQVPLYLSGARMMTFYPVSIIVHSIALNVTVQTYCGNVYFGVIACKKAVPDLAKFTDAMHAGFDELIALAEAHEALAREREAESLPLAREVKMAKSPKPSAARAKPAASARQSSAGEARASARKRARTAP